MLLFVDHVRVTGQELDAAVEASLRAVNLWSSSSSNSSKRPAQQLQQVINGACIVGRRICRACGCIQKESQQRVNTRTLN
jgi:hypothetical protein